MVLCVHFSISQIMRSYYLELDPETQMFRLQSLSLNVFHCLKSVPSMALILQNESISALIEENEKGSVFHVLYEMTN